MKTIRTVSLFSGAGGMDMGFERQGYQVIWANDIDKDACATHRNWSNAEVVCKSICDIPAMNIPDCDVMLGGFPCQGFSLSGPRRLDDSRNKLYREYVRIVDEKRPLVFVGENVKGILTMGDGQVFEAIREEFAGCGYDVYAWLLNARNFGVPQDRERVIIAGFRKDLGVPYFDLGDATMPLVSIGEALRELSEPDPADICMAPYSSRYMSRNRRRGWNEQSFTIPAMAKQVPLHPSSPKMEKLDKDLWKFGDDGPTRRFSYGEAAVIQTFPMNMEFSGNLVSKYKQVGNAVPVKFAEYVAGRLLEYL